MFTDGEDDTRVTAVRAVCAACAAYQLDKLHVPMIVSSEKWAESERGFDLLIGEIGFGEEYEGEATSVG